MPATQTHATPLASPLALVPVQQRPATPPTHDHLRGAAGAARNGTLLMPDEVRRLDEIGAGVQKILVEQAEMKGMLSHLTRQGEDHETRIRKLERAIYMAAGAGTIGGATLNQILFPLLNR